MSITEHAPRNLVAGDLVDAVEGGVREVVNPATGERLDAAAIRAQVDSPTYLGALWTRDAGALVDPARLCWGLASAAEAAGYVVGFTGLGVGASRFGARVALDLLDGLDTARGSRWSGGGRFRSRRSRRAGRRSGSRSARSRAPTSAPGGAGRGCGRSTGSAWDSTRE